MSVIYIPVHLGTRPRTVTQQVPNNSAYCMGKISDVFYGKWRNVDEKLRNLIFVKFDCILSKKHRKTRSGW